MCRLRNRWSSRLIAVSTSSDRVKRTGRFARLCTAPRALLSNLEVTWAVNRVLATLVAPGRIQGQDK